MLAVVISFVIGALTVALLYSCCAGKKPSQQGNNRASAASNMPVKKDVPSKPISEKANHLQVMLGIPEKGGSICVAVNMNKIYDDCYQGMNEMITALAEVATVHLIVQSSTDKDEEHQTKQILAHLQDAHIPSHRVLHHSSNVGKIAFLRQIKPYLHVEFDDEIYNATKVHIPLLVFHPSASSNASVQKSTYLHVIDSYHDLAHVELRV